MIDRLVQERLDDGGGPGRGRVPGAVVLVARAGDVRYHAAHGDAVRYADATGRPAARRVPMRPGTIFDLASITKLFTAVVALRAVEDRLLGLDAPVCEHLPGLHRGVTLRRLLTHTSGLAAGCDIWNVPGGRDERTAAVLASPVVDVPGRRHVYSCTGYLVAGLLLERVLGEPLPTLVARYVTGPLAMRDTEFRPAASRLLRVAATEDATHVGRGTVRGEVHDEASWSLGGTGGNAGVFGTASDLYRFAEMLRAGGVDPVSGVRVMAESSVELMTTDQLGPGMARRVGYGQGLGSRVADRTFMGTRTSARAFGHTGFTGTSVMVDPDRELVVILLANAIHPVRGRTDMGEFRRAVADAACRVDQLIT